MIQETGTGEAFYKGYMCEQLDFQSCSGWVVGGWEHKASPAFKRSRWIQSDGRYREERRERNSSKVYTLLSLQPSVLTIAALRCLEFPCMIITPSSQVGLVVTKLNSHRSRLDTTTYCENFQPPGKSARSCRLSPGKSLDTNLN